jgi:hypothetical protein
VDPCRGFRESLAAHKKGREFHVAFAVGIDDADVDWIRNDAIEVVLDMVLALRSLIC